MSKTKDPIVFGKALWPDVTFYREQKEIIYSVWNNDETVVPAGNMLGKDFVAAFIALVFFLTRHPCRIVTTSAKDDHLRVLWGEIHNFINTCAYPLEASRGGPLIVNQRELRKMVNGKMDGLSYVTGMVASPDRIAAFQGHHIAKTGDGIPRTLFIADEASGVPNEYYTMASTWANRMLIIGNPWDCQNFFRWAVDGKPGTDDKGGDIKSPTNNHFERRVIKIKAVDSPNIRLALAQEKTDKEITNEIIVPGIKGYTEYLKNRRRWDKEQQCVSLDAEFYKGATTLLFPPEWLNLAEELARKLEGHRRVAKTMCIDPAEGGNNTAMAALDELGVIDLVSKKTPDTSVITSEALAFMRKHGVKPENVLFDAGGGGKAHADRLRRQGYNVRTVFFGASATAEKKRGMTRMEDRKLQDEVRYVYVNRRTEMYGLLSLKLDPSEGKGFAIPAKFVELRQQLSRIPKKWDEEGRLWLPPKNNKDPNSTTVTLREILGCSPDEADAVVLAVFGLVYRGRRSKAGVAF